MQSPHIDSGPVSRPSGSQSASAGDVIRDRYHLEREAVRTEAGMVFDATDLVLSTRVAVEVASSIIEPRARGKWTRDAMMAQRLEGEHVLRVIDAGALPNGVPFMVREVATKTLADEVAAKGALPLPEAVAYTLDACEALAEGHALGMAHGDLRLDNVHVAVGTDGPVLKVSWTSAAKAEVAAKEDVARDIAGLGALLRVLATGRLDIQADGAATLPADLAHTVGRALAEDRQVSFNNVSELAQALAPFAPPGHTSARNVALLLSRVGIVGAGMPRDRMTDPPRISLAPVSRDTSEAGDRASITDEWFGGASRTSLVGQVVAPAPSKRGAAFAFVSLALISLVLSGTWLLFENGKLPRWSGAAPPEEVGTTQVTNAEPNSAAPAAAAPPAAAQETIAAPQNDTAEEAAKAKAADDAARARAADEAAKAAAAKSTSVAALPDAPANTAPGSNTPASKTPAITAPATDVAPTYASPKPTVEPVDTAPTPTTTPAPVDTAPTPNAYDPSTTAPSTMAPAPTTPAPTASPDADPKLGF